MANINDWYADSSTTWYNPDGSTTTKEVPVGIKASNQQLGLSQMLANPLEGTMWGSVLKKDNKPAVNQVPYAPESVQYKDTMGTTLNKPESKGVWAGTKEFFGNEGNRAMVGLGLGLANTLMNMGMYNTAKDQAKLDLNIAKENRRLAQQGRNKLNAAAKSIVKIPSFQMGTKGG